MAIISRLQKVISKNITKDLPQSQLMVVSFNYYENKLQTLDSVTRTHGINLCTKHGVVEKKSISVVDGWRSNRVQITLALFGVIGVKNDLANRVTGIESIGTVIHS